MLDFKWVNLWYVLIISIHMSEKAIKVEERIRGEEKKMRQSLGGFSKPGFDIC